MSDEPLLKSKINFKNIIGTTNLLTDAPSKMHGIIIAPDAEYPHAETMTNAYNTFISLGFADIAAFISDEYNRGCFRGPIASEFLNNTQFYDSRQLKTNLPPYLSAIKSRPDDLLFIVITGHGGLEENGMGCLGLTKDTSINEDELSDIVKTSFMDNPKLVLSGVCYSYEVARGLFNLPHSIVITSSQAGRHTYGQTFSAFYLNALRKHGRIVKAYKDSVNRSYLSTYGVCITNNNGKLLQFDYHHPRGYDGITENTRIKKN